MRGGNHRIINGKSKVMVSKQRVPTKEKHEIELAKGLSSVPLLLSSSIHGSLGLPPNATA